MAATPLYAHRGSVTAPTLLTMNRPMGTVDEAASADQPALGGGIHTTSTATAEGGDGKASAVACHLHTLRCFVLPDLEAANWGASTQYYKEQRSSACVSYWQLYMKKLAWHRSHLHHSHSPHPQAAAAAASSSPSPTTYGGEDVVFGEVLLHSLAALVGRYSRLLPSRTRIPQVRIDAACVTAAARRFRIHIHSPQVQGAVCQTLADFLAIAVLWTAPLQEVSALMAALRDPTPPTATTAPATSEATTDFPTERDFDFIPAVLWYPPPFQRPPHPPPTAAADHHASSTGSTQPQQQQHTATNTSFNPLTELVDEAAFRAVVTAATTGIPLAAIVASSSFSAEEVCEYVERRPEFRDTYPPLQDAEKQQLLQLSAVLQQAHGRAPLDPPQLRRPSAPTSNDPSQLQLLHQHHTYATGSGAAVDVLSDTEAMDGGNDAATSSKRGKEEERLLDDDQGERLRFLAAAAGEAAGARTAEEDAEGGDTDRHRDHPQETLERAALLGKGKGKEKEKEPELQEEGGG
eukprot:TRINITY_DN13055_c0_g2_i1.p1 TRINITY_DN13055_c0_g2~~TRINITY_DN13055_c0_g2_i1.p1  ORF type:complete len:534 (+),score=105.17 TRINITY_DN13055_c0_g2_i1:43-1602(+)